MFIDYCIRSKPYDFCHMPSRQMTIMKIKEYMQFLFETCEVYLGISKSQIKIFIAVSKQGDKVNVEFIFGNPFGFMKNFSHFRDFYKNVNQEIQTFEAQIKRKYKLNTFLKFIQAKDSKMKIILDKQEIAVLWNT
jgi:hypothetical protein